MYFRKLIGERCYLSPIDVDDAGKFAEWLNDLEVTVNLQLYGSSINVENERTLLEGLAKEHNYSIVDKATDELIGNCGFVGIDSPNRTGEAGIFIGNKKFWGRGYGTEALTLLVEYGFKALNLHNIFLQTYDFNKRAIRAYEKAGFKRIGVRREALYRDLRWHDIVFMDILPNE
jgi:RimJ/RimL family protein N-acetyltransferase